MIKPISTCSWDCRKPTPILIKSIKPAEPAVGQQAFVFPSWIGVWDGDGGGGKSNLERVKINIAQAQIDFEANVIKLVKQFNLQAAKVAIGAKDIGRAARRNDVAYRLTCLGNRPCST